MSGGFGSVGFGIGGMGYGLVTKGNSSTAALLVKPDGTRGDVVRIDAHTGNYVLDSAGRKTGDDATAQMVYLALRTRLGSSAVQSMGIDLPSGTIADDIEARVRSAVDAALKLLTDTRRIELVDVITKRVGQSAIQSEVRWRELSTGQIRSTFV